MSRLILEPTSQAQWQTLVHEAQTACDRNLDETLESYLVFLLMRFADKPECTARIMAEGIFPDLTIVDATWTSGRDYADLRNMVNTKTILERLVRGGYTASILHHSDGSVVVHAAHRSGYTVRAYGRSELEAAIGVWNRW